MADKTNGPEWVARFLAQLAATGRVKQSARAAGITSSTAYFRRNTNRQFAAAWQAALGSNRPAAAAVEVAEAPPGRTVGWRVRFLEALAETSNVKASAIRANVPIRTVYKTRREDAEFAAKWLVALQEGYDHLEMELLGYLRNPQPGQKMDTAAALRLLAAHRDTVERRRALTDEEDKQATLESIDRFIEDMRQRRAANTAILIEAQADDGAE